ncbi:CHASE domain-containing protein [Candidatus Magnetobacterium casense]|uniref:histidine kinase n=1 Tax=Candidatus Magnetobacterium casense TaxID=1455061 RepID=A0ABS6RWR6_9BACT|nr:CHASE domain-containing protein [Candidatus Magnetobacterium casensis]MBV6340703.1 CHASE domain-containing protein [Candidatus Magnetobacterium casensis]
MNIIEHKGSKGVGTLRSIILLVVLYFISGRLALFLAIPPGYATPIWPPSGVALAFMLLYSYRVWPGIWLGSFLLNAYISLNTPGASVALPGIIATGAVLQTVAATYLIQCFVGRQGTFEREQDLLKLLLIGGPLSCIINAGTGSTAMLVVGAIKSSGYMFSLFTWWLGDTIGVIVVTPLALILMGRPAELWRRKRNTVVAPIFTLFVAVVVLFVYVRRLEEARVRIEFAGKVGVMSNSINESFQNYIDTLESVKGLYEASDKVERHEFKTFVRGILSKHRAIQALSWNPRVSGAERTIIEEAARADGYGDFRITQRDAQGKLVTASDRQEYIPVYFLEPYKGNEAAMGFDLASNPSRKEALVRARDSGQPQATGRITLVQEKGKQFGMIIFAPVYSTGQLNDNIALRRANIKGFISGVFRIGDAIEKEIEGLGIEGIYFAAYDDAAMESERLMHVRDPEGGGSEDKHHGGIEHRTKIRVAGRAWSIVFYPSAEYLKRHMTSQSWLILVGSLLFIGLLEVFLFMLASRGERVERLVHDKTTELSQANAALQKEITEKMATEVALRSAMEEAKSATKAKGDFLAAMSHEIRTPLNAIIGMTDVLSETGLTQEQNKSVQLLRNAGENLLGIINDILDFSKMEAGQLKLERVCFNIFDTFSKTADLMRVKAQQKGINLSLVIVPAIPMQLWGDPLRLQQVMFNLLSNAIKFTDAGEIGVTVDINKEEDGFIELQCCVRDTGVGIAQDKQGVMFQRFSQADSSTSRKYGGTGLGLVISKTIVENMRGRMWFDSKEGVGSRFYFTVQLEVFGKECKLTETPSDAGAGGGVPPIGKAERSLRILIAEDNEDNQVLMRSYFKKAPHVIEIVPNGQEAVDKFTGGSGYDIVLMDMEMPLKDGYTAVAEIRQWERDNAVAATPILALTAHALNEHVQKSLNAGCNGHLTKPIKKAVLMDAIAQYRKE